MRVNKLLTVGAVALFAVGCGGDRDASRSTGPLAPSEAGPSPPAPSSHAYFDLLSARPEVVAAYSLRDQAQLDQFVHGRPPARDVTYNPSADTYPLAQDAAKVVLPAADSTIQQVRLAIGTGPGKTLITWDAWWGAEWQTDRRGMSTQKTFQIGSHLDGSERWLEVRMRYSLASLPQVAMVDLRAYADLGPNVTNDAPVSPQIAQFPVTANTWTRFWLEVDIRPGLDLVSFWAADTTRDPVQLLDRREVESAGSLTDFWLEYNGSGERTGGPLVSYVRNLIILQDVSNAAGIMQRPQ